MGFQQSVPSPPDVAEVSRKKDVRRKTAHVLASSAPGDRTGRG